MSESSTRRARRRVSCARSTASEAPLSRERALPRADAARDATEPPPLRTEPAALPTPESTDAARECAAPLRAVPGAAPAASARPADTMLAAEPSR